MNIYSFCRAHRLLSYDIKADQFGSQNKRILNNVLRIKAYCFILRTAFPHNERSLYMSEQVQSRLKKKRKQKSKEDAQVLQPDALTTLLCL